MGRLPKATWKVCAREIRATEKSETKENSLDVTEGIFIAEFCCHLG